MRSRAYPGNLETEEKIRHFIRWNSLLMVLKANKSDDLGGHISTFSSAATLYEVGFNHFFRGSDKQLGDLVYFQGHSSPGIYTRSFLEDRLSKNQLDNFRKEIDGENFIVSPSMVNARLLAISYSINGSWSNIWNISHT